MKGTDTKLEKLPTE